MQISSSTSHSIRRECSRHWATSQLSDFIKNGEWGPGFNAQNEMLDEYMKKYKLQDQDWRKQKPWYTPK